MASPTVQAHMAATTLSTFQQGDSSTQQIALDQAASHTRTYQACIPCRKRKVRCDLGPVDDPHEPPCIRCRREHKECFFSATRRKKRETDSATADTGDENEFETRNGRKRAKRETDGSNRLTADGFSAYPLTPSATADLAIQKRQRLSVTTNHASNHQYRMTTDDDDDDEEEQVNQQTAAILQNAELHSSHDALNVLLEAATHHRAGSSSTAQRPTILLNPNSAHDVPMFSPDMKSRTTNNANSLFTNTLNATAPQIDPAISNTSAIATASAADLTAAIKAWSRFKFVRAGWFTAREAIDYVDFFYTQLSPLTPIVMPLFTSLGDHAKMLEEEPMLTVTILTIASRHMKLTGAGSMSRPYAIHNKLWSYLEGMINRLVWGQEQFASAPTASAYDGSHHEFEGIPYCRKGLRTLGTVESLMLLTEWHPRNMHFPPDDDDAELLLPEQSPVIEEDVNRDNEANSAKGIGGQRMDTWLEPCWRSDRICWMLLSMAMSLAFEIGVFVENATRHVADPGTANSVAFQAYEKRRLHVKDLLLIYISQTSGRVGLTSMLPKGYCEPTLSALFDLRNVPPGRTEDLVIHLWLQVAYIMKKGNQDLFPSRALTRDIIRTGRYKELLSNLYPVLKSWRQTIDNAKDVSNVMRHVLNVDYEYCRVYLNSLGLQAVVERCTKHPLVRSAGQSTIPGDPAVVASIPPSVLEQCYGGDRFYINEVIDGCRNCLKSVVEGLYPGEHLKHAPVRTYLRIISVAIILLKTFALGATEEDVAISLGYLNRTIEALQTCIVDDVHVASRFADLLETLANRIRSRFVRMSRTGPYGFSRAASRSPAEFRGGQASQPVNANALRSSLSNQQWTGAIPNMNQNHSIYGNRDGINNPLHGISTQAIDFNDHGNGAHFNVMPPPTVPPSPTLLQGTFGSGSYQANDGVFHSDDNITMPDWLALPLDPILNSYGADVTQTGYGPGVGQYDMLELLLSGSQTG